MSNQMVMTEHHRCPRSLGGKSNPENISVLEHKRHRAWHLLFKNHPPEIIAKIINRFYLDPDWEFVVVRRRKKKDRHH